MATTCASFLLLALGVVEVFGRLAYVKSTSESGEIARGKPVTATSTCGAILPEKYCYSTGEIDKDISLPVTLLDKQRATYARRRFKNASVVLYILSTTNYLGLSKRIPPQT